jgi:DNA modification methylase
MIQLINGDCLEGMKAIDSNSINLAILDLPYGETNCKWDNKIDLVSLWTELKRIGKPNTAFIFFCSTKFGYELISSNPKMFKYDLVWSKPNSSAGFLNAKKMPLRSHEMIYIFYDKLPFYNILEHHTNIAKKSNSFCIIDTDESVYKTKLKRVTGRQWEPALPKSVLTFDITNKSKKKLHPTQKPIELIKWLIKYYSKEGDTILDPTFGCGTTAVACNALGRHFIGFELDTKYFDIANELLKSNELTTP